jgi:hypothetical protein
MIGILDASNIMTSALSSSGFCTPTYTKTMRDRAKPARDPDNAQCAAYVRVGLQAGGANVRTTDPTVKGFPNNPVHAEDYGPVLSNNNFTVVSNPSTNPFGSVAYIPMEGDTAVFGALRVDHPGHIETYTGGGWISDYVQNRFWAGNKYETANNYVIYRPPVSNCQ